MYVSTYVYIYIHVHCLQGEWPKKHIYLFTSCPSANSQIQVLIMPRHHYASKNIKLQMLEAFKAIAITALARQIYILEIMV